MRMERTVISLQAVTPTQALATAAYMGVLGLGGILYYMERKALYLGVICVVASVETCYNPNGKTETMERIFNQNLCCRFVANTPEKQ